MRTLIEIACMGKTNLFESIVSIPLKYFRACMNLNAHMQLELRFTDSMIFTINFDPSIEYADHSLCFSTQFLKCVRDGKICLKSTPDEYISRNIFRIFSDSNGVYVGDTVNGILRPILSGADALLIKDWLNGDIL